MADKTIEIRFQMPLEEIAVVDGVCQATGKDRTTVIREWLGDRSKKELHVATLICRVSGVNPMASDKGRPL